MNALIACALIQPQPVFKPTAKVGEFYLIGPRATISGTNEKLELGLQRLIRINAVKTSLAFGTKRETVVAPEGKKLVLLYVTLKNPESKTLSLGSSDGFAIRVHGQGLKEGDVSHSGCFDLEGVLLDRKLKKGEAVDAVSIYQMPAAYSPIRVIPYYRNYDRAAAPRYDLTSAIEKPTSVFAETPSVYRDRATVQLAKTFDLDGFLFKVGSVRAIEDSGFAVTVQVTNPMLRTEPWGWQYAAATLKGSGLEIGHYPEFYVNSSSNWAREIAPGQTINGEYRFYPTKAMTPETFTLKSNATKRSVLVPLE